MAGQCLHNLNAMFLLHPSSWPLPSLPQGLRKSSDCGRPKRTIMPHSVPHMVRLRKFIVSEDTVFLLLHYAEGMIHTSFVSLTLSIFHISSLLYLPPFTHSLPAYPCCRQMFDRVGCMSQVIILNTRWCCASLAMLTPGHPYFPLTNVCVCVCERDRLL